MKIETLKALKRLLTNTETQKEKEARKEKAVEDITRNWQESEVQNYNFKIAFTNPIFLRNPFTEEEIKKSILSRNKDLFTEDEYQTLLNKIFKNKVKKIKK